MGSASEEVERLRKKSAGKTYERKKESAESLAGRTAHQLNILQKFGRSVLVVVLWLWWNFGNPILNKFTVPVIMFVGGWYIRLWNWWTFPKDEYGVQHFSVIRGAQLLVTTLATVFVGWQMLWLTVDATMFVLPFTSQHEEAVYLFGTTDNSFADDNWSVTGCEIHADAKDFECSHEDTLYYRVGPNLFNYLWHISWNHWNPLAFFLPEVVTAPIAPGWNVCKVTAYGIRVKWLVRNFQWYVNLISADCKPVLLNQLAKPAGG